jgi:hypothetical protein
MPIATNRRETLDHRTAFRSDLDRVRYAAQDRPGRSGAELASLAADCKRHRAADYRPHLLVLVNVLGKEDVRVKLDERKRDPLTLHCLRPNALPDWQPRIAGNVVKDAHQGQGQPIVFSC